MFKSWGWHRDPPDHRDFTLRHDEVAAALARLPAAEDRRPDCVDWRDYFPPVDDQRPFAAGSVYACVGMLQYFERRAHGRQIHPSRLFIYKNARRLPPLTGDCGVSLRATLRAIRRFGLPPDDLWPDRPENLDREPDAFAYSFAQACSALTHVRIDARGLPLGAVVDSACSLLANGFCFVLGFSLHSSLSGSPLISYPTIFDSAQGGQAVVAVGYDNRLRIRSDKGAFLVRNSWGDDWGEAGYGWLPYAYIREGLAADLWTVLRPDWLDSGELRQSHD